MKGEINFMKEPYSQDLKTILVDQIRSEYLSVQQNYPDGSLIFY